jgi:phenylpropionate dioxygenase-like ring-hydroxylating dioxygenase large terminal subunit
MKAAQDSEDLTRVGPGTVMGEFMRQYWIPAVMSGELAADGEPVRLALLGEKLIAFRDTSGRVGVMDHRCPHRCASLFLGRNEHDGIRCVYHGWKFDVTGRCVDMPSVPAHQDFKDRVRAKAYPALERNGLVWVYMGPEAEPPPLPMIEATLLPEHSRVTAFVQRECNWLQALEGDIDTSHFGFLHAGHVDADDVPEDHPIYYPVRNRAPEYHVTDTDWGTQYAAHRDTGRGGTYWRFANFMFPFWTQQPQGAFPTHVGARAWVPMDDEHTMFVHLQWQPSTSSVVPLKNGRPLSGSRATHDYLPAGTGWTDRWRLKARPENDWLVDRDAQRANRIYSGIENIHLQDQAVTESMGPLTDHAFEHLGPGDLMIARTRRRLLRAARALRDAGTPPPGAADPAVYWGSRSGFFLADGVAADWRTLYDDAVGRATRPVSRERAQAAVLER